MKRLKHPKKVMFFNTVAITDVGLYLDTHGTTDRGILQFKKEGIALPGHTDISGGGTVLGSKIKSASAAYTDDGLFKGRLLKLDAPARDEDINYDYSLTLRKLVKTPGVNTFHNNTYQKTYGGTLPVVTTTSGYVDDTYKLAMEDDLLDDITNDNYMHNQNTDLVTNFAGPIVEARRVYVVSTTQAALNGTNVVCTLVEEDGTSTTLTMDQATLALNIDAMNVALDSAGAAVHCAAYGPFAYAFIGETAGEKFTLSTASSTYSGSTQRYIYLSAKDQNVKFESSYTPGLFTQYKFGWTQFVWVHDSANAAGENVQFVVNNGAMVKLDTQTTGLLSAASFNASTLATGGLGYASAPKTASTTIDILWLDTADTVWWNIKPVATAQWTFAGTTGYLSTVASGRYPSLTSDEVFRAVALLKDGGRLTPLMYADQPTDGSAYAKYTLKTYYVIDGEPLASEETTYVQETVIYMLKTAAQTNVWDLNGPDLYGSYATTPDKTFEDLLGYWSDVVVTSWE